jgi:Zn-finger nucleic acid-binding protein
VKCPLCEKHSLLRIDLEEGLTAHQCKDCQGIWVSAPPYRQWLEKGAPCSSAPAPTKAAGPEEEPDQAKFCPECERLLTRYRFSADVDFHLDRCFACEGVWFDRGEWDVLKAHDLQQQVHHFFSPEWQEKLRQEEARRRLERIYLERYGPELYTQLQQVRRWIERHPRRSEILAFLNDPDPYSTA